MVLQTKQNSTYGLRLEIWWPISTKLLICDSDHKYSNSLVAGKGEFSFPQQCTKWIKFKQINSIGRVKVIIYNLHPCTWLSLQRWIKSVFAVIFDDILSHALLCMFFNIKLLQQRFLVPASLCHVYYNPGWGSSGLLPKSHLVVLGNSSVQERFWRCLVKWWTVPVILQTYPLATISLMRTEKAPILMKSST